MNLQHWTYNLLLHMQQKVVPSGSWFRCAISKSSRLPRVPHRAFPMRSRSFGIGGFPAARGAWVGEAAKPHAGLDGVGDFRASSLHETATNLSPPVRFNRSC